MKKLRKLLNKPYKKQKGRYVYGAYKREVGSI